MKSLKKIWFYISASEIFLAAAYLVFLLRFFLKTSSGLMSNANTVGVMLGFIGVLALFRAWYYFLSLFKLRVVEFIGKLFFMSVYLLFTFYYIRMGHAVDYAVIADNLNIAGEKESIELILSIFKIQDYISLLILLPLFGFIEFRYFPKRKVMLIEKSIGLVVGLVIFILIAINPVKTIDAPSLFARSVYRYHFFNPMNFIKDKSNLSVMREFDYSAGGVAGIDRPNIFLILVESFNTNHVDTRSPNGKEYMPFFNSLKKQGWYYKNFWGQSMQTSKGQFAIFCSMPSITRKKVFTDYPDTRFNCLPKILSENNYDTFFFKGFSNIHFDNTYNFTKNIGFRNSRGMDPGLFSYQKGVNAWGWGAQDDWTYRAFFKEVDKHIQESNKPIFASITTLATHGPWVDLPANQRYIFENPKSKSEFYANAIRVTDEYLKTFFEELNKRDYQKNSIVMIFGDHGHPVGEHGNFTTSNGGYDENFRTPLLILWPQNSLPPKEIEIGHSQLDIAPTVLDLLRLKVRTHFWGESVLSNKQQLIPLIQPYAGTYLGVMDYPYKYLFHASTLTEYYFNLIDDPLEQNNLEPEMKENEKFRDYRDIIGRIYHNDFIIKNDKVLR